MKTKKILTGDEIREIKEMARDDRILDRPFGRSFFLKIRK